MFTVDSLDLQVETVLRKLRIDGTLKGYHFLVYAIAVTVEDPRKTELITKEIYPDTAKKFKTTVSSVERDIRFAVQICWYCAREMLDQMAGYQLVKRPTNRQFIDIVAFYIRSR